MAFDFPIPMSVGEVFIADAATGKTYIWSGVAWSAKYKEPPAGTSHPPAETIPVEPPIDGADSVDAVLRNLAVEIDAVQAETGNKVDVAGDTMTGALILSEHPTVASPEFQAATKLYVDNIGAGLPLGGNPGEALVLDATGVPAWGAPINADVFTTAAMQGKQQVGSIDFGTNNLPRWKMNLGDGDEADFVIQRYNDGGGRMGPAIRASRSTGVVDFDKMPTIKGKSLLEYLKGVK